MKYDKGFALVSALFVLVVLAAVAGFAVSIASMNRSTVSFSIQGTRAYFAAHSGLEWGVHEVIKNNACPANTTLNVSQGGLRGFSVSVTCTVALFTEGATHVSIFALSALSSRGIFGDMDYVSREMHTSVVLEQ